jgi:hypothetical protein
MGSADGEPKELDQGAAIHSAKSDRADGLA